LQRCKHYVNWQTRKVDHHIMVDYKYTGPACGNDGQPNVDITQRIHLGLTEAKSLGCKYAFVFEDDDWYRNDYIEKYLRNIARYPSFAQYGIPLTYYMHVSIDRRRIIGTPNCKHSSLHAACFNLQRFNPDALLTLESYHKMKPYLDDELFNKALLYRSMYFLRHKDPKLDMQNMVLSIKHDVGQPGGFGHNQQHRIWQHNKRCFDYMKIHMDEESFVFYSKHLYK